MSRLQEGIKIYQSQGLSQLIRRARRSVTARTKRRAENTWYNRQDTHQVSIAGCEAVFPSPPATGGRMTRQIVETEQRFLETVLRSLNSNDVFWDIGANLGVFTCLAGDVITDGKIISVEPNPRNARRLRENLKLNGIQNAEVLEIALSNNNGIREFIIPTRNQFSPRGNLAQPEDNNERTKTVDVDERELHQIIEERRVPKPTVMKLDIEGAEALAVDGFGNALSKCRELYSEIHAYEDAAQSIYSHGMTENEYLERVANLGFENNILARRNNEIHLRSTNLSN